MRPVFLRLEFAARVFLNLLADSLTCMPEIKQLSVDVLSVRSLPLVQQALLCTQDRGFAFDSSAVVAVYHLSL